MTSHLNRVLTYAKPIVYKAVIQVMYEEGKDLTTITEDFWECDHQHTRFENAIECANAELRRRFPEKVGT